MAISRKEFSAGGVVYKKSAGAVKVALIAKKGKTVWCLPKGKIEKAETAEDAAVREIREETGLEGKLSQPLGEVTYWFVSPHDKARVFKKVRFFLFKYIKGSLGSRDIEVEETRWFSIPDALKAMTYPSEKGMMQKAKEALGV